MEVGEADYMNEWASGGLDCEILDSKVVIYMALVEEKMFHLVLR